MSTAHESLVSISALVSTSVKSSSAEAEIAALLDVHPDDITSLKEIETAFKKLCQEEVSI